MNTLTQTHACSDTYILTRAHTHRPHSCPTTVLFCLCFTLFHHLSLQISCFLNLLSRPKFFFFINCLFLAHCLPASLSPALTLPPHLSLFFSRSVVCPQVEYNSCLPRGVMNGRPLLKCLSITFECLLSLTSERHTRWACSHKQAHAHTHARTHKHTRGSIFVWTLCAGEVVFS